MSEYVREVDEQDFAEAVVKSKTLVLVDFWAQWCGPCRSLAPIVEATAEQYTGTVRVFKVNIDNSPAVAQRYGIRSNTDFDFFPRWSGERTPYRRGEPTNDLGCYRAVHSRNFAKPVIDLHSYCSALACINSIDLLTQSAVQHSRGRRVLTIWRTAWLQCYSAFM